MFRNLVHAILNKVMSASSEMDRTREEQILQQEEEKKEGIEVSSNVISDNPSHQSTSQESTQVLPEIEKESICLNNSLVVPATCDDTGNHRSIEGMYGAQRGIYTSIGNVEENPVPYVSSAPQFGWSGQYYATQPQRSIANQHYQHQSNILHQYCAVPPSAGFNHIGMRLPSNYTNHYSHHVPASTISYVNQQSPLTSISNPYPDLQHPGFNVNANVGSSHPYPMSFPPMASTPYVDSNSYAYHPPHTMQQRQWNYGGTSFNPNQRQGLRESQCSQTGYLYSTEAHLSGRGQLSTNQPSSSHVSMAPTSSQLRTTPLSNVSNSVCPQYTVNNITVDDLRPLFHLTLAEAAKHLGMCTTLLKKICRKMHIEKWPYRQIHSLVNKVASLEHFLAQRRESLPSNVTKSCEDQICDIRAKVEKMKDDIVSNTRERQAASTTSTTGDIEEGEGLGLNNSNSTESNDLHSLGAYDNNDESTNQNRKRRMETSYDYKTGWIANCSTCGKVGKYRHPAQGRVFQHSLGSGRYCGYYRDNPRPEVDFYSRQPFLQTSPEGMSFDVASRSDANAHTRDMTSGES